MKYGLTWWGEKWLDSLTHIDYDNRLPRGRAYAGKGAVLSVDIDRNQIDARVQGSTRTPYKINITVPAFSEQEKQILLDAVINNPFILSKLLNRELPSDLADIAKACNIKLFPSSWCDFGMNCSCPDWAVPCKHLAAVIYVIANEIDKNPFLVFSLHNFDIIDSLKKKNISIESSSKENILKPKDLAVRFNKKGNKYSFNHELFKSIDFSIIENIRENIVSLLSPKPLFFEKDFKITYNDVYKKVSKNAVRYLYDIKNKNDKYSFDNEKYEVGCIEFNDDLSLKHVSFTYGGRTDYYRFPELLTLLDGIETKSILNLSDDLIVLHTIYHFCLKLLEQGAFIPRLLNTSDKFFKISWLPAFINENVKSVHEKLSQLINPVSCYITTEGNKTENKYFSSTEAVNAICSVFFDYFINKFSDIRNLAGFKNLRGLDKDDKILYLFFVNKPTEFSSPGELQVPNSIQLWINKFYITHKEYVPLIEINEQHNIYYLNILVENKSKALKEPIPLELFLNHKNYEKFRFELLKDLTLLSEHFNELKEIIKSNGKKKLQFTSIDFVDILLKILPSFQLFGISLLLPKALRTLVKPQLSLKLKSDGSKKIGSFLNLDKVLSFDWQIAVGDSVVNAEEFRKLVKGLSGIVKIKDQYILINDADIEKLFNNLKNPPELSANDLLKSALTEEYNDAKIFITDEVRKLIRQLTEIKSYELPDNLNCTLRPYQVRGYEWMFKNSRLGFGSLIADDMGLGKTLQVIALLLLFKQKKAFIKNKALVVVPTTLITNWLMEIERFAPELKAFVYHGSKRELNLAGSENMRGFDLILTTYGLIRKDIEKFKKISWHTVVVDEAQNIKNPQTEQTKAIKQIKADVKIAMTGTPVENRLSEYWSILDYVNKGYLGSSKHFNDEFATPIQLERNQHKLNTFLKITQPFILRRMKTDKSIIKDLPDKIENNQYCSLEKEQAAIYQNVVNSIMEDIEKKEGIERRGLILKLMTALKQICNHPSHFLKKGEPDPLLSGKSTLLLNILENIFENNEKTLIFTQYKEMGDLLVRMIEQNFNTSPLFLHGGVSRKNRDLMVSDFQNRHNVKAFVLSLKAGGTGLNLTAACNVIHYDLWWNPAVENQATDRAFRIGQTKNVMVYRLLTKGTFEEKIDEMLKAKKELSDLTVTSGEKWIGELSNSELKELIKLSV